MENLACGDCKKLISEIQREINVFKTLNESNPNLNPTMFIQNLCDILDKRRGDDLEPMECTPRVSECEDDPGQAGDGGANSQNLSEPSEEEALRNILVIERLLSFLNLETLKVVSQVNNFFNIYAKKAMFEKHYLTLAPLADTNRDDVLIKAYHLQNFIIRYAGKVTFYNIKPSTVSLAHFEEGLFRNCNLFSKNVKRLVFDEHGRVDRIHEFCQRAKQMPNLRYLLLPELDILPDDDHWEILLRTFGSLDQLDVKLASTRTLTHLLSLPSVGPAVKNMSVSKWVLVCPNFMSDYLKAPGFHWKFRKIEIDLEPQTSVDIVNRFLQSQADTVEKLRIDFSPMGVNDPHPDDYPVAQGNLADNNWFLPVNLGKLKYLRIEELEAPVPFLERTLISILQIPNLKMLDMLEDTVSTCDGWHEQMTGHTRNVPLQINSLKAKYYLARLHELEKEYAEALLLYQDLLLRQRETLGDDHFETIKTQENIAMILGNTENEETRRADVSRSIEIFRDIYDKRTRTLGQNHPSTFATQEAINVLTARLNNDRKLPMHTGTQCDGCGIFPVMNIRYRCMHCEDFDFCEMCKILKSHMHPHFWAISFMDDSDDSHRIVKSDLVPWIAASEGHIPEGSLVGGQDENGQDLIVARAKFAEDLLPGKLVRGNEFCIVPWNTQQHAVGQYEVLQLRQDQVHWELAKEDENVPGAIIGGMTEDGEFLYIGRVLHEENFELGKVHRSHRSLYISSGGLEISYPEYEILVLNV